MHDPHTVCKANPLLLEGEEHRRTCRCARTLKLMKTTQLACAAAGARAWHTHSRVHTHKHRRKLQAAKAGAKANVSDRPFKVASPMKDSACPGDFVGTLGGKVEYVAVSATGRLGDKHV